MSTQMRLFDGYAIEIEQGRIGIFDIEPDEVEHFRASEVLVLVVTATVSGESTRSTPSGDFKRTNNLKAHVVHVANGLMRDELIEFYNLTGDELPFPTTPAAPPPAPPEATTPVESPGVASQLADAVAAAEQDLPPEPEDEELPPAATDHNRIVGTHDPALIGFLSEV